MAQDARVYARTCGFIYILIFLTAIVSVGLAGNLIVAGNATATAAKILASEELWRAGYSAEIFSMLCDVAVAWLLYVLLAPVHRNLALLAALFRITYVAGYIPAVLGNVMVLPLLREHLQQAAMFAVRAHDAAWSISLIFFGANLVLVGYLIARAPVGVRWLAVALEVAGACYIVNSFSIYLTPSVHALIYPWILLPPFIAELSLTFWLLLTRRFNQVELAGRGAAYGGP
jgi:Domain of unknown function (DUF4386)